ncbi:MAG: PRC-barrel domain-containing protein [Bauldia sp.]
MPNIQTPSGTLTAPKFIPQIGADQLLASELVGATVYSPAGENLGDVNDIVLASDGSPYALVVGVGGFLGLGEKNVAVSYAAITPSIDADGKLRLTFDTTKEELDAAPAFSATAMMAPEGPVPQAPSPAVPVLPINPAPNPAG